MPAIAVLEIVAAQTGGGRALAGAPGDDASGAAFTASRLVEMAKALASKEYVDRRDEVPDAVRELSYDAYRTINVRREAGVALTPSGSFVLDTLPAGFVFVEPVSIFLVDNGVATPLTSSAELYDLGELAAQALEGVAIPFSGFRLRHPINSSDKLDEVAVFQGATYFRALGKGNWYGVSARGLAIDTGEPTGEEFPVFRAFWIEKAPADAVAIVIYALLDSPSVTGAYRFTVRPGEITTTDVELTLFVREDIGTIGFAPFSSMFLFDAINRNDFFDYREAVHDSDGLSILTGAGEWIWRALDNPGVLQISGFQDNSPRGFGLIQRKRNFGDFEDAEARYQLRPSVWVEPIGDWGPGAVVLFEIPSREETNDNIVAYWQPRARPQPGEPFTLTYRVHWGAAAPQQAPGPQVLATRQGETFDGERTLFVVDYILHGSPRDAIRFDLEASAGTVANLTVYPIPGDDTVRVAFDFDPQGAEAAELRLRPNTAGGPAGESWFFRWTP